MNCDKCRAIIELYCLAALDQSQMDQVRNHLDTCPACSKVARDYQSIVLAVSDSSVYAAGNTDDLAARIKRTAVGRLNRHRTIRRAGFRVSAFASIAAGLVLILTSWYMMNAAQTCPENDSSGQFVSADDIRLWQQQANKSISSASGEDLIFRKDSMYTTVDTSMGPHLLCADADTGSRKWLSPRVVSGGFAVDTANAYFVSPDRDNGRFDLVACDMASGRTKWFCPLDSSSMLLTPAAPAIVSQDRVCWNCDSMVYMIDSKTGHIIWDRQLPEGYIYSRSAVCGQQILITNGSKLYRLNIADGADLGVIDLHNDPADWKRPLLAVDSSKAVVVSRSSQGNHRVICSSIDGSSPVWAQNADSVSNVHLYSDVLYLRSEDVRALSIRDGKEIWSCQAAGCGPVTCSEGLVYFVDKTQESKLTILDAASGKKITAVPSVGSCDAFVKVGSRGYLKTYDDSVTVINFVN